MKENLFKLVGSILSSENTKVLLTRMLVVVVLGFTMIIFFNHERIISGYLDTRLDTVMLSLQEQSEVRYQQVVREQVQSSYALIRPSSVMVMSYRPININNFLDMVYYEGALPDGMSNSDFTNIPVNKTSREYQTHILGSTFSQQNNRSFAYQVDYNVAYRYSCPIYNLKNIYAGVIVYNWYSGAPFETDRERSEVERNLAIFCTQSARAIGRSK